MSCLENYRLLAVSSVTLVWRVRVVLAIVLPACFHLVLGPGLVRAGIKIEFALHRPSTTQFFFDYDEGAPIVDRTLFYGAPNDIALLADFDGDTIVDLALYRDGIWFINLMNDGTVDEIVFLGGDPADLPVAGDFLGNGLAGIGVFRSGTWYLSRLANGVVDQILSFGAPGDKPVVADFDGDGKADCAVYRPTNGFWFISYECTGMLSEAFLFGGAAGDVPVAGDFGGAWLAGVGIYRNGLWFLSHNRNGVVDRIFGFGAAGDRPLVGPLNPANSVFVKEGALAGNGSQPAPFGTIVQAVAVASPGTTVRIAAGIYPESVFLPGKQNLTFVGAGVGATHLVGSGDAFVAQLSSNIRLRNVHIASPDGRGIIAQGSSMTLDRVSTIGNQSYNVLGVGYLGTNATLLIEHSNIDESQVGNGLRLEGGITATVQGSTIDRNGTATGITSISGRGVEVFNDSVLTMDTSSVSDNYFGGILLTGTGSLTISLSEISRNGHNGIAFDQSSSGNIFSNVIDGNGVRGTRGPTTGFNGIELQDTWTGSTMLIHENQISNSTTNGIFIGAGTATVANNYLYNNFVGLSVWQAGNVAVRGNTFELPIAQGNEEGIYMSGSFVSVTIGGPFSADRNTFTNYIDNPTIHCDTVGGLPVTTAQAGWNLVQNSNLPNIGCNCTFP
jgi:Right handed beta helix region